MSKFTFHVDAGHGWLSVTGQDLRAVGLTKADFSKYSYCNRSAIGSCQIFYLEEDCDAAKFFRAYEAKFGVVVDIVETIHPGDCFIRRLPRIGG